MRFIRCGLAAAMWFVGVSAACAQKDVHASTSGICSPVVTGGSSQINIHCSGLSEGKANQLVGLMNRILAEHLDLSEVNAKLGELGSQLEDISTTLNPMTGAPPQVLKLYEESQELFRSCQNMGLEWSRQMQDHMQDRVAQQQAEMADLPAKMEEAADVVKVQQQQLYRKTLLPELTPVYQKLLAPIGSSVAAIPDLANPRSSMSVSGLGQMLLTLEIRYEDHQTRAGAPIDPTLKPAVKTLAAECTQFSRNWAHADVYARGMARPNFAAPLAVDVAEAAKYHAMLAPELISWRSRAQVYVPNYVSTVNYEDVTSATKLMGVCMDLGLIQQAYQQKRQNEILEKRAAKAQAR